MHPYLWFESLPLPMQTTFISGLVSFLVAWITHLRNTRPILVFVRRPDWQWRVCNVGQGTAFDVLLEDSRRKDLKHDRYRLYPIGPGEDASLGALKYGDKFTVYYRGPSSIWPCYRTVCTGWRNRYASFCGSLTGKTIKMRRGSTDRP
jgi:hypothetical protein